MFRLAALFGLLGLAAATGIIAWSGYAAILAAVQTAGWGILGLALYHLTSQLAAAIGWRALIAKHQRPSFPFLCYALWLRAAVNNLLPVAKIGGEVAAVRVLIKNGMRRTAAIASITVELTLSVAAQFLFIIAGLFILALRATDQSIGHKLFAALAVSLPLLLALVTVQRIGFFGICDKIFTLLFRDKWRAFAGNIARLDRVIHATYRRQKRVLLCLVLEILSWSLGTGDIWIGSHLIGHPLDPAGCFILECLVQGSVSAGFAVPAGLGVQEASFLFFGQMLGLTPETAVALAVLRRCRDLILYLPGLIAWQMQEGKRLFQRPSV